MSTASAAPSSTTGGAGGANKGSPSPSRGGGQGGRGGRGRGGRNHAGNRGAGRPTNAATKFKGNTAEMNGHVFQCFNENGISNQFTKTVEALAEYIAKHLKFPGDMTSLTEDLVQPTLTAPVALPADADELTKLLWKQDVVQYAQRRAYLASNYKATYAVIWGQCSEAMRAKLKSDSEYLEKKAISECGWLLKEIKGIMMRFESKSKPMFSLNVATKNLYAYQQGANVSKNRHCYVGPLLVRI